MRTKSCGGGDRAQNDVVLRNVGGGEEGSGSVLTEGDFLFLFKSCIRLFRGTKNSRAAVSYGVNKTYNKTTNKRKS